MKKFAAVISYDGNNFFGFQLQKDVRTVQGVIEQALERIFKTKISVVCAGRTDTGVHAVGQVIAFDCPYDIPPENMKNALNANLPDDVYVRKVIEVPKDFNPRFCATRRIYHYFIYNGKTPNVFTRKYYWWFPYELDVNKMREAAKYLEGEHDFKAFAKTEGNEKSTVRTIYRIRILRLRKNLILIRVEGRSFLRRMVRNIVGALVKVGVGVWEPIKIKEILESRNRSLAPATAPAHGLYLYSVEFSLSPNTQESTSSDES
ncbi:tRNA pseudouridine(38-40) synthase TruA [Pseudothermotoga thermarum]|uniref:tRNA pseudouridine synthase A n=1 Tax=Pseudothermotoga thermarum DSM 5069 TaxID=688269 RepID=F7YYT8_9THEM|nr:tRNA pseudouridine(38-40) synthase TruA [Pseudothermotoga thermarum]AEH51126.1 tRNA pseudouridine synthase A [Pseudothermotoga thermarum DSM 5069]